jgi:hypothetical protein
MTANIFQTLFDVSISDKVNGIAENDNLIGGGPQDPPQDPLKVENTNPSAPASNAKLPSSNVKPPAANVKPAPAKESPANAPVKPAPNEPAPPVKGVPAPPVNGVPVLSANANVTTNAKSTPSPEPELKIVNACETNQIFKRAIIIIFVFTLATYLAAITLTVRPILEFVLGPDINLNINNNDDYIKKWFSIAKLILIYIAFIIAYVIGIILVIACIVMVFILFTGSDTVIEDTQINMLFWFWQFEEKSSIWYIYAILLAIILISVYVFLHYHWYIKSYLDNLSYPKMAETGQQEFPTPTKFIFYFGLYLSMLYLLYMLVLNNALPGGSFLYTYIIVGTFMLFLCIIYKYTLIRSRIEIPIATWFIFALSIFIYAVLWELIPQLNMSAWAWLIVAALVITSFILISTLVIIVILGFQENSPLNRERIEMLIGPISALIIITVIGLLIFLFVSIKDKLEIPETK